MRAAPKGRAVASPSRTRRIVPISPQSFIPILLAASLTWASPQPTGDGRDFTAFFRIGPVDVVSPDEVRLAVSLRVANHGETVSGSIRASGCGPERREIGASTASELPGRDSTRVNLDLVMNGDEYEAWQAGCDPTFEASYLDSEGQERRTPIEAAPGPVPEGE